MICAIIVSKSEYSPDMIVLWGINFEKLQIMRQKLFAMTYQWQCQKAPKPALHSEEHMIGECELKMEKQELKMRWSSEHTLCLHFSRPRSSLTWVDNLIPKMDFYLHYLSFVAYICDKIIRFNYSHPKMGSIWSRGAVTLWVL